MAARFAFSRLLGVSSNCLKPITPNVLTTQRQYVSKYVKRTPPRYPEYIVHKKVPWIIQKKPEQEPTSILKVNHELSDNVVEAINDKITSNTTQRLFAVVQICGKQFKVTENDIVIIQGYWPPNPSDELKLEKVLLCGGKDFTLIGQPLLNKELITVDATVIEKSFSPTKTRFRMRPRKQYKRIHFYRIQQTMLRINSITINGKINEKKEFEGLDKIF